MTIIREREVHIFSNFDISSLLLITTADILKIAVYINRLRSVIVLNLAGSWIEIYT